MKYFKRLKIYKHGKAEFNPNTLEGTSYGWYYVCRPYNGAILFNDYNYSPTTNRHIHAIKERLVEHMGDMPLVVVQDREGLRNIPHAFETAYKESLTRLDTLKAILESKRRHKTTKKRAIEDAKRQIKQFKAFSLLMESNKHLEIEEQLLKIILETELADNV